MTAITGDVAGSATEKINVSQIEIEGDTYTVLRQRAADLTDDGDEYYVNIYFHSSEFAFVRVRDLDASRARCTELEAQWATVPWFLLEQSVTELWRSSTEPDTKAEELRAWIIKHRPQEHNQAWTLGFQDAAHGRPRRERLTLNPLERIEYNKGYDANRPQEVKA